MSILITGAEPTDLVTPSEYFRATFTRPLSFLPWDAVKSAAQVYGDLRGSAISYVTPINDPSALAGDSAYVIDLQTFTPDVQTTVGQLANALNGLRIGAALQSLALVQYNDVYGDAGTAERSSAASAANAAAAASSPWAKLGTDAKWIGVAALVVVGGLLVVEGSKLLRDLDL